MKDEPFRWSLDPARADSFTGELGWSVATHADSNVLAGLDTRAVGNRAIVTGEEVIEATATESRGTPTLRADSPGV